MQMGGMRFISRLDLIIAALFIQFLGGCSRGLPDPPVANNSTAATNIDDPDVYKPAKPRSAPTPPPSPDSKKDGLAQSQPPQSDPDVYVPEKPRTPPPQIKKEQPTPNDSDAHKSDNTSLPLVSQPPTQPKIDAPDKFDPDVYVPEKPRSLPKTVQQVVAEKKSANDLINSGDAKPLNLSEKVQIYQSEKTDNATRLSLEKQFITASREALQAFLGFSAPQTATQSQKSDTLNCVVTLLWDGPFVNFLDLQHQALTTLAERPTTVALAVLTPNSAMRADLRRTLSRHWSEGPKAISVIPAVDYPLAEPGFITVLKSLIRENRAKSSPQLRSAKAGRLNFDSEQISNGLPKLSSDSDWNKLLEALVRDYCRRSHLTSLARSAASYRNGADSLHESHKTNPRIPLLPGCEIIAAYRIDWPGDHISKFQNMAGNDLSLDYQRIEKRMKLSKPLNYYRRQVKSCIEHTLPDGLWLDGFVELKEEESVRTVDVLITCPKTDVLKSVAEEQELTVEILSIEVHKSHD
jgi:hypothetical protein